MKPLNLIDMVFNTLTVGLPNDSARCEGCMYKKMVQPEVTYAHADAPDGWRYRQPKQAALPPWAVDIRDEAGWCYMFKTEPETMCLKFKKD